ncbi:MAG: tetratricopeptide repeat protein [Pseudomonadota bacterium]
MRGLVICLFSVICLTACDAPPAQLPAAQAAAPPSTETSSSRSDHDVCDESTSAERHDGQKSIDACTRLIDSGNYEASTLAKLYRNRAVEYRELRLYSRALEDAEKAIDVRPDYARAWRTKASVLRKMDRPEEALVTVDRAIQLDPDNGNNYGLKSKIFVDLERFEEAREAIDLAIALNPGDVWTMRQRGWITYEQDNYETALRQFREALALKPDSAWTHYAIGYVLVDLDRPEEALNAFDRSIELDNGESSFFNLRGYTYLIEGEPTYNLTAATADLERAVRINPRNTFAHHHLAAAYALAGDGQRAVSTLRHGVKLQPLKAKIRRVIRILFQKGLRSDAEAASELLERSDA